ncbi:MAG: ATP-binding cassette domain-containing protein, partial [Candidatus Omnitrophota bacterium]
MIKINSLYKSYGVGGAAVRALDGVSLSIAQGEFVAIMGASGSGKSTLMHMLGFLDRPDKGSYAIFGAEASQLSDDKLAHLRNNLIGFVFQQFHLLRNTTAIENVELPLIYSGKKGLIEAAGKRLDMVGLSKRYRHLPNQLSGGEQQRVAIARALVNDPMIILADEPTGNLDTKSEEEVMKILLSLNEQGKTIIMVTHEHEVAAYAKRIIVMRDGKIISDKRKGPQLLTADKGGVSIKNIISEMCNYLGEIELKEHIRQSFRAISANKVRSLLSMLGILFGVAAVIAMLALGQGAQLSMENRIKSLGSNLLSVQGGSGRVRGVAGGTGTVTRFLPADADAIANLKPMVDKVSGYVSGNGQLVHKNENWSTRIEGVDYDY